MNFITEIESAEQLSSFRLQSLTLPPVSTTLAAFTSTRPARSRGRPRGIPRPQTSKQTYTFCKTCYEGERGKSTYLSHNTEEYNCPTKVKLNIIVEELLPQEVIKHESDQEEAESADNT